MPSLSNINKRDETASKPDTGKYGLEPFMGATGYAVVVCCPVYTVIGIVVGIVHQVKKRKQRKAGVQKTEEQETGGEEAGEKSHATDDGPSRVKDPNPEGKSEKKTTDDSVSPTIKRSVSPPRVTHGFKGDPKQPSYMQPRMSRIQREALRRPSPI
jgi:heme exporter protein D